VQRLIRSPSLAVCGLLIWAALSSQAALSQTFTTQSVNVRAGPDRSFPLVTWLPPRTQVRLWGCTSGWRWCDVSARGRRGWVHSRYLSNISRRTPIIAFSVGSYWDLHYRGRPWYAGRPGWDAWGSPGFRPPPTPMPGPPSSRPPRPGSGPPPFGPPPARSRPF
jgi:uncharacterized protein YraI